MNALLVDTDVVSFAFRGANQFDLYHEALSGHELFISFATLAELMRGTLAANWGEPRRDKLAEFIRANFAILNTNRETCVQWAKLTDEAKRQGFVLGCADAWVAATAVAAGIPLVSHNRKHFAFLDGLTLISHAPVTQQEAAGREED